jgi:Ca2+-binding EF-hand superfamily protein
MAMKRMMVKQMLVLAAAAALMLAAASAFAQPGRPAGFGGPPSVGDIFAKLDKNADGKLTQDELPATHAERIMKADTDGDGAVTKEELEQARQARGGRPSIDDIFAKLDKNADGKLTQDELPERLAERIMKADTDGDGAVTKEELQAARDKFGPRPGAALFRHFDRNGDGRLVASEVPDCARARLQRADTDGDGGVTFVEVARAVIARISQLA